MALSHPAASLTGLPSEILLDIFWGLDVASIFRLVSTNRYLQDFFRLHKASILLPVLAQEFSPFDELIQVFAASADDLTDPAGSYIPRTIIFKRYPGDSGHVLAPQPRTSSQSNGVFVIAGARNPTTTIKTASTSLPAIVLNERHLDSIVEHCLLVRTWELRFPQMRWLQEPENCRSLRLHERLRFRRALYRWWLYGIYFHGEMQRPRVGLPEPLVQDIRTSQMRRHSTTELLELMDLVETMKDVVLHYICPRLDPNHLNSLDSESLVEYVSRGQSLATSWNDQSRWGRIVKTYAKLGPQDLMYYFENIYSYPRVRLLTEIRLKYPNLTFDQESIQIAIRCALDERNWLDKEPSLAEDSVGGIIDFDDERDDERIAFDNDASGDGQLPSGSKFVRSFSQYSPRGDDGQHLEESYRQERFSSRYMVPADWEAVMH